ncbi:MAG: bifunctional folylpolyglutamate synthase/dihydrofolate synthase [Chthoniobacterales bacterium]|nr:bifunctional folylpolyglutamate synthase/dihydrofolate synthase [Chthoniobacterales bacterium]
MEQQNFIPNWQNAIRWLYDQQQRGIKVGLENTRRLLNALGNPHLYLPAIHVAGTNGKGSVCAFTESILRTAGLKTGLFTSPHLVDFRERIRSNGEPIPIPDATEGILTLRNLTQNWTTPPTFFELTYALAIWYFSRQKLDVIVLETGMGGRLDSTNVCHPIACAITPVGLDHQQWLGDTIPKIAAEKAGILKPNIPCILYPQVPEAEDVIIHTARIVGAPIHHVKHPWPHPLPLAGPHQKWNAATAALLAQTAFPSIGESTIQAGLAKTQWPARFERLSDRIILDGAHNTHAIHALLQTWLDQKPLQPATIIFACLNDKNPAQMLHILAPIAKRFIFPQIQSPRAMPPSQIAHLVQNPILTPSTHHAIQAALQFPNPIVITGSLHLAGEVKAIFANSQTPIPTSQ